MFFEFCINLFAKIIIQLLDLLNLHSDSEQRTNTMYERIISFEFEMEKDDCDDGDDERKKEKFDFLVKISDYPTSL